MKVRVFDLDAKVLSQCALQDYSSRYRVPPETR